MLTAAVDISWGDEGKGRMADSLSREYDIICRYQGGNNAGHTVINEKGRFILNLLPSGILRGSTVNIMGNGMGIDLEHLCTGVKSFTDRGIAPVPGYTDNGNKRLFYTDNRLCGYIITADVEKPGLMAFAKKERAVKSGGLK